MERLLQKNIMFGLVTSLEREEILGPIGDEAPTQDQLSFIIDKTQYYKFTSFDRPCRMFRRFKVGQNVDDIVDLNGYNNYGKCIEISNDCKCFLFGYFYPIITDTQTPNYHHKIGTKI